MKESEQKAAARSFAVKWKGRGYEKGETQPFWLSLLRDVYGVEQPENFIVFEEKVKLGHASFIDARIPETHVIIEQKSLGKDLSKAAQQSDGTFLTPFQQAKRYADEQPYSKRPRWIVASNFSEFRVHDMEHPGAEPEIILLQDLPQEYYRLQFLVSVKSRDIVRETRVSKEAGEIVGRLYDALLAEYRNPDSPETLKSLNKLCVRLVFCLYAESSGAFGRRNMFREYLTSFREQNARMALIALFDALSTPMEKRDPYMDERLAAFPYVNGGLFDGEQIEIPRLTPVILDLLIHQASEQFDWSAISPTIFGAVFESTMNQATRRAGGLHYTSLENIHKVIDPLFLDGLRAEFEGLKAVKAVKQRRQKLREFQDRLASLRFLDPACGSGNFLTESYLSLRRLENDILRELAGDETVLGFEGEHSPIKVSIHQFYGIEINDFAVAVSKAALWIAESQAMQETENIVHMALDFLPLKSYANIVEGNALRMEWEDVIPKAECSYIMGNPPFVGYAYQSAEQKEDLRTATGLSSKNLDYVAAWYFKSAEYMRGSGIEAALVSTNSITQGEQVAVVWKPLMERHGIRIQFAHRSFRWDSESSEKAHVHVVIVGFGEGGNGKPCSLYSGEQVQIVDNISPYLVASPTVFIEKRNRPLCAGAPPMVRGSQPTDDGNLVLTLEERDELARKEHAAVKFLRPFMMGKDFIDRKPRYCLWLVGANPAEIKKCPCVVRRIEAVREFRLASRKAATRKKADTPMLFDEIKDCGTSYIAIPKVSSEQRRYIPMDYLDSEVIAGDMLFIVPDAGMYHFGILMSNVHMAWMRAVAGRLEMRYSYSNTIVYNNFPWPTPTDDQESRIEQTAKAILDARAIYPNASLADLYGESLMPPELRKAHQANDRAVMAAYGFDVKTMTEASCVAELMRRYRALTQD